RQARLSRHQPQGQPVSFTGRTPIFRTLLTRAHEEKFPDLPALPVKQTPRKARASRILSFDIAYLALDWPTRSSSLRASQRESLHQLWTLVARGKGVVLQSVSVCGPDMGQGDRL